MKKIRGIDGKGKYAKITYDTKSNWDNRAFDSLYYDCYLSSGRDEEGNVITIEDYADDYIRVILRPGW